MGLSKKIAWVCEYSFVSNKRRVANKRRVWKKYQNLINEGSRTNGGPGIFATLYKEVFENSHFISIFNQFFKDFFKKLNKRRVWKKYLNLINEGSGTNGGPRIFVTVYIELFKKSHFIQFSPNFSMILFKNK